MRLHHNLCRAISIVLFAFVSLAPTANSQAQATADDPILWEARETPPAQSNILDFEVITDAAGNIYTLSTVHGYLGMFHSVFKYSPNGQKLWEVRHEGTGKGFMVIDPEGRLFLAGKDFAGTSSVAYLSAYSSSGIQLWNRQLPGTGAFSTAVDLVYSENAVYLGAYCECALPGKLYTILKYGLDGDQVWAHGVDQGSLEDLAVGKDGAVYGIGHSAGGLEAMKLNGEGQVVWQTTAPATDLWGSKQLVVDSSGSVFVGTGISYPGTDGYSYIGAALYKFNPDGELLWRQQYKGEEQGGLILNSIAIDSQDNLYLGGESQNFPHPATLVKFGPEGSQLWEYFYRSPTLTSTQFMDLTVDTQGNLLAAARVGTLYRLAVLAFDPSGNKLWEIQYPEESNWAAPVAIAADGQGGFYVAGEDNQQQVILHGRMPEEPAYLYVDDIVVSDGGPTQALTRYTFPIHLSRPLERNLKITFATYEISARPDYDYRPNQNEIMISAGQTEGSVTISGWSNTTVDDQVRQFGLRVFASGVYVPKSEAIATIWDDDQDAFLWSSHFNTPNILDERGKVIGMDREGNVYVTGEGRVPYSDDVTTTFKVDPQGNILWSTSTPGTFVGTEVTPEGEVYIVLNSYSANRFSLVKLASTGEILWQKAYTSPSHVLTRAFALALDSQENLYIGGEANRDLAGDDIDSLVVKYTAEGQIEWARIFSGKPWSIEYTRVLAVSRDGSIFTGTYRPGGENPSLILQYSPSGQLLREIPYRDLRRPEGKVIFLHIGFDPSGALYLSGEVRSGIQAAAFITKMNADGTIQWVDNPSSSGSGYHPRINNFTFDPGGNVIAVGSYENQELIIRYSPDGRLLWNGWFYGAAMNGEAYDALVDSDGTLYVTGESTSAQGERDFVMAAFDHTGQRIWFQPQEFLCDGFPETGGKFGSDLVMDEEMNIYVTGETCHYLTAAKFHLDRGRMFSVASTWIKEHEVQDTTIHVPVRLSSPAAEDIHFRYTTIAGTARPGEDYTPVEGTASISAGSTSTTIEVPVLAGTLFELEEFFFLRVFPPDGMAVTNSLAMVKLQSSHLHQLYLPGVLR